MPVSLRRLWRVPVGEGYSSPVVVNDRIFIMTRRGGDEVCLALSAKDGKEIWNYAYDCPFKVHSAAVAAGPGPKATMAYADGRIFAFGITEVLTCLDAQTGKLVWQNDFRKQFNPFWPETGASASPLALDGKCIVQIGVKDKGGLAAFDQTTGKLIWQSDGDGPSYTAPEYAKFGGAGQIISLTQSSIVGVQPDSGKALWSFPFKTPYDQNIVSPVFYKNSVIFTGTEQMVMALTFPETGGGTAATPTPGWQRKEHSSYMSAPVINGERLFLFSEKKKGVLVCLHPMDGRILWESPGRMGDYASLTLVQDKLLMLTDDAKLRVIDAAAPDYHEIISWDVAPSSTWAHPAISGGRIYVKDVDHLACLTF
ncbi:PQQ-binding-like beta-propeller repeat protein [Candidatus Sumerlaeota bacterium]|nr:PQQ-binding-like beta-propeller repeat protein [Candidatus Sumerlaeota bacterium]